MRSLLSGIVLVGLVAIPVVAQSPRGVWKRAEVVISGGPNAGSHTSDVQPSLLIITRTHYSMMLVTSFAPRPALGPTATDEERGKVWTPFTANAGTYTFKDSTLSFTASVAKNPNAMAGNTNTYRVRTRGDSLWMTQRTNDGIETRSKWVRIERP